MISRDKVIVGFSTTERLFSKLIRRVEKTPFSHVYIRFYSSYYDRWLCYHARLPSLHFLSKETLDERVKIIEEFEFEISEESKKELIQYCIDNAGRKYGILQLVGMAISRFAFLWFNWKIKNPFSDGYKSQVCSELVYYVAKNFLETYPKGDPEYDGPRWIYSWTKRFGKKIENNKMT